MTESLEIKFYDLCSRIDTLEVREVFDCGDERINSFLVNNFSDAEGYNNRAIGAFHNDRLVGCIIYCMDNVEKMKAGDEFISEEGKRYQVLKVQVLGVHRDYQKKGVGTGLIGIAIRVAKTAFYLTGCYGVFLEALRDATQFYENLGFQHLECLPEYVPGKQSFQMFFSIHTKNTEFISPYFSFAEMF